MHARDLAARDIEAKDFVGRVARERIAPGDPAMNAALSQKMAPSAPSTALIRKRSWHISQNTAARA
jgi:hypothetical protein